MLVNLTVPQAALVGAMWPDDDGWAYRLTDEAGADLLRARLTSAAMHRR
jgi:hypothetical protein